MKRRGALSESTLSVRKPALCFAMTGAQGLCGGIASANLNVLQALVELAQEQAVGLTVLSYLESAADRPDFVPPWVHFHAFQGDKGRFVTRLLRAAAKRPLLCFDHVTLALPVLPLAVAGILKTIILAHGSEAWKRIRRTSRWSLRHAALCLTNSQYTLNKMRRYVTHFKAEACPLGLPLTFRLNRQIPATHDASFAFEAADGKLHTLGGQYLLLVARMDESEGEKGHRVLIRALPALLDEFPHLQVVFPGPGNDRQHIQQFAQRHGVASSVILPGFVSMETLRDLYHHCYAYVMPSTQEGFGLAYLEAMNYAKPCVGCYDQGAEDVIVHGVTGFLLGDPSNFLGLLGILRQLLHHPKLARRLGEAGFKRLQDNFTSHHYRQRLKGQIARVL